MRDVAGVRLHVRDTGPRDAPAVILIHGFGASLHTWERWANGLSDGFQVIRFDLPGSGFSGVMRLATTPTSGAFRCLLP